MPRLVDWTNLGGRPAQSERPMADISTNAYEQGVDTLGRGMRSFGGALSQIAEKNAAGESQIGVANANAHMLRQRDAYMERMREKPDDYASWEKTYQTEAPKWMKEAGALIQNPRARSLWEARQQSFVESNRAAVARQAFDTGKKSHMDFNNEVVADFQNRYVAAKTPEEQAMYREAVSGIFDDYVARGFINQGQATEAKRLWAEGTGKRWLQALPAPERVAVLRAAERGNTKSADEEGALKFFQSKGLTPEQAAGVVGNLIQESSLRTGARNPGDGRDGSDSIGLAQWNSARARMLKQFADARGKPVTDRETQLEFVWQELNSTESRAFQRLKQAKTVDEATAAFIGFERPQGWTENNPRGGHGWSNRLAHANRLAGQYKGSIADVIPADQRQQLLRGAEAESRQIRNAEHTQRIDQMQYLASKGLFTAADADNAFLNNELRSYEEMASIKRIAEGFEKAARSANVVENIMSNADPRPFNPRDKLLTDAFETEDKKQGGLNEGLLRGDANASQQAVRQFQRTGYVSPSQRGVYEGIIRTGNAQQLAFAMPILDAMKTANPNGFAEAFDKDTEAALTLWQRSVDRGTFFEQLKRSQEPQAAEARKVREERAKKVVSDMSDADLVKVFDESIVPFNDPKKPIATRRFDGIGVLRAEYADIMREAMVTFGGDEKAAKEFADRQIKMTWGDSPSGGNRLMKYPPEMPGLFQAYGGSKNWLREQVEADLRKRLSLERETITSAPTRGGWTEPRAQKPKLPEYALVPVPQTKAEIDYLRTKGALPDGRRSPAWYVVYKDPATDQWADAGLFAFDVGAAEKVHVEGLKKQREGLDQRESEIRQRYEDLRKGTGGWRNFNRRRQEPGVGEGGDNAVP